MPDYSKQGLTDIAHICKIQGIQNVVITPGSRNASLVRAFIDIKQIKCVSITDERSAAYFALGVALKSRNPVAVLTTSGTAILNLAPAIAEAFYQHVPLIILTADRPPRLINQNQNQTLDQVNVYQNYIKKSYSLSVHITTLIELNHYRRQVAEAIVTAEMARRGPVHVNIPIEEPLYTPLPPQTHISKLTYKSFANSCGLSEEFLTQWQGCSKKMIIIGQHDYDSNLESALQNFQSDKSVVILADPLSNIYLENEPRYIEGIFTYLENADSEYFKPDLILHIGYQVLSKKLLLYLQKVSPKFSWIVEEALHFEATYSNLNGVFRSSPVSLLETLPKDSNKYSHYKSLFKTLDDRVAAVLRDYYQKLSPSDFKTFSLIYRALPSGSNLHLGNSSVVRYLHFMKKLPGILTFSNRGVSGIDGSLSTAMGFSYDSDLTDLSVLIIGDISFIYDSNAMWFKHFPSNLKVIILNNAKGQIFSILDTGDYLKSIALYLETPQDIKIDHLVKAYNLQSQSLRAEDLEENHILTFFKSSDFNVLEIDTSDCDNADILKELYSQLSYKT